QRLAELANAGASARANVRIAPRRWRLRPIVDAELTRLNRFDGLAEAGLGTARATFRPFKGSGALPMTLRQELAAIGMALRRLAGTGQPWPKDLVDDVRVTAERIAARATAQPVDR